ncbi:primosomal protein DnaT [Buchnera aphidicola (Macrosiphoniella sanborni)]|uniref:Replication restart protein DnaT n=1 Tax=Buchnera aphidicola (Macrosiphoniella sanborni) TaxID=1241865 RepID=A0A4D6YD69_9GAMM|nr:primosomal protein DnaT [Buchnera aphidicola]QCI23600.1 primosomal protein DnaT [Buchnera aphidicola (Macrosiphoniella sanborni)]
MKILVSNKITLDTFCHSPKKIIDNSHTGIVEILKNNSTICYVITPIMFNKIFNLKYKTIGYENIKKNNINKKFSMHPKWTPDKDFIRQAALWGITLTEAVSEFELACFISYWQAEGCFFYHIQWQQKLARSLQKSRSIKYTPNKKRDITYIPKPDQTIPDGFRGK